MITPTRTPAQITAQVAVEAIVDDPNAYAPETVHAVLAEALAAGVSPFYTDMLAEVTR